MCLGFEFSPQSHSLLLTDLELLAQHLPEDFDLILPLLYGFMQPQLSLLQRQHGVCLVVQKISDTPHLYLHDVAIHHVVLMMNT